MVRSSVGQESHALALPRLHGAEALAPFMSLSDVIRPEAVSLRAVECFRVSQKFDHKNQPP